MNRPLQLTAVAIGFVGFGLVIWQAGWIAALGLLLAMTGNNLERAARRQFNGRGES